MTNDQVPMTNATKLDHPLTYSPLTASPRNSDPQLQQLRVCRRARVWRPNSAIPPAIAERLCWATGARSYSQAAAAQRVADAVLARLQDSKKSAPARGRRCVARSGCITRQSLEELAFPARKRGNEAVSNDQAPMTNSIDNSIRSISRSGMEYSCSPQVAAVAQLTDSILEVGRVGKNQELNFATPQWWLQAAAQKARDRPLRRKRQPHRLGPVRALGLCSISMPSPANTSHSGMPI